MSSSPDAFQTRVLADSGSPTASVTILDSNLNVVASAGGSVEAQLAPGIYKVRYSTTTDAIESRFEIAAGDREHVLERPSLPSPRASALERSPVILKRIRDEAVRRSREPALAAGAGSSCFVYAFDPSVEADATPPARHPALGLKLLTFDGSLIADMAEAVPTNGCAGRNIDLDSGSFLLRFDAPDGPAHEQTIVTCKGWQTQVLIPCEQPSGTNVARIPNLENATVLMSRHGTGLSDDVEMSGWVDMARDWLARGEPVAPVAELQRAVETARALRGHAINDASVSAALQEKFTNPMLGIYAAHLLTLTEHPDEDLLREVAGNLKLLLGDHPDVTAIDLWLDNRAPASPFVHPPMLRNSWSILLNRTGRSAELIPKGSYSVRITDRLWGAGAWLVWCTPEAETVDEQRALAQDAQVDLDLSVLTAFIRKNVGAETTSQFVTKAAAEKNLTSAEASVLFYVSGVVEGQNATMALGKELQNIDWLGPLNAIYQRIVPSSLEKHASKAADTFLTEDSAVRNVGLPKVAFTQATAGLFEKFGLK